MFSVRFIPQRYVPISSGIQIPNFWGTLWFLYLSFFLRNHCKQNVRYCFYFLQFWSCYLQKLNFVYLWRPIYSLCKYLQKDFRINSDDRYILLMKLSHRSYSKHRFSKVIYSWDIKQWPFAKTFRQFLSSCEKHPQFWQWLELLD